MCNHYHRTMLLTIMLLLTTINAQANCWSFTQFINSRQKIHEVDAISDGSILITAQHTFGASSYNQTSGVFINSTNVHYNGLDDVLTCKFSKSYSMVAYAGINAANVAKIAIIAIFNFAAIKAIATDFNTIVEIDFSYDDLTIIACGYHPTIPSATRGFRIYNIATGNSVRSQTTVNEPTSCEFAPDGSYAISTKGGEIIAYDAAHSLLWTYLSFPLYEISELAWSFDSSAIISGDLNKVLRRHDISSNQTNSSFTGSYDIISIDWSNNKEFIAAGAQDASNFYVTIYDGLLTSTLNTPLYIFNQPAARVSSVKFSADNKFLFAGTENFNIYVYSNSCNGTNTTTNTTTTNITCLSNCLTCNSSTSCITCMIGYYLGVNYCEKCSLQCSYCDLQTCFACQNGKARGKGCTSVIGCTAVIEGYLNLTNNCLTCDSSKGFTLDPIKNTCICQAGNMVNNEICHSIAGCVGPVIGDDGAIVCQLCNMADNYQMVNSSCTCKRGYGISQITQKCEEICGDGVSFTQKCDDGNTEDGDGCSSDCKVQPLFRCQHEDFYSLSVCLFYGINTLKLNFKSANKKSKQNIGLFIFLFSPSSKMLSKGIVTNLNISPSNSIETILYTLSDGQLKLEAPYNKSIQGTKAQLSFTLNHVFYRPLDFTLPFSMISDGQKLILQKSYDKFHIFQAYVPIIAMLIVVLFVVGSSRHKMAGVQLIITYQIIMYVFMLEEEITGYYSRMKFYTYTNLNFLFFWNQSNNYNLDNSILPYSETNGKFSEILYFSIAALTIFLLILSKNMQILKQETRTKIQYILYNYILFPFTMAFFHQISFYFYDNSSSPFTSSTSTALIDTLVRILFQIVVTFIVFFEWKMMFFSSKRIKKTQKSQGMPQKTQRLQGMPKCSKFYIPTYLTLVFLVLFFLTFSKMSSFQYYRQILTATVILALIAFIIKRPYKQGLHNATQIMNLLILAIFLMHNLVRKRIFQRMTQPQTEFNMILAFNALVVGNILLNIIRIVSIFRECYRESLAKKQDWMVAIQKNDQKVLHKYLLENPADNNKMSHPIIMNRQIDIEQQQQTKEPAIRKALKETFQKQNSFIRRQSKW